MTRIVATLILLLFTTTAIAEEKTKSDIQIQAETAYTNWMKAVEAKNMEALEALYAPNVEMMTSLSKGLIKTKEEREECFKKLFAKQDLKVSNKKKMFDLYEGTTPIMSGIFTFTYTEGLRTMRMPARFSFIYQKSPDGKLLIYKQHTSSMPL